MMFPELLGEVCKWCRGSGKSNSTASGHYRCEDCNGSGEIEICDGCGKTAEDCDCACEQCGEIRENCECDE